MTILIMGLFMWCAVHLFPVVAVPVRARAIARYGLLPYKSCFALLIITSIVLIVSGWRAMEPGVVYQPPVWGRGVAYVLVFITFTLFVAAKRMTNIKRVLRHPQLTGVMLWSIGHLFANGDNRSLILFAGIGLWSVLEIALINRRAGAWIKPQPVPVDKDIITVAVGVILYGVLLWVHPYLSGVAVI